MCEKFNLDSVVYVVQWENGLPKQICASREEAENVVSEHKTSLSIKEHSLKDLLLSLLDMQWEVSRIDLGGSVRQRES